MRFSSLRTLLYKDTIVSRKINQFDEKNMFIAAYP